MPVGRVGTMVSSIQEIAEPFWLFVWQLSIVRKSKGLIVLEYSGCRDLSIIINKTPSRLDSMGFIIII
jgi:hypothetical protein